MGIVIFYLNCDKKAKEGAEYDSESDDQTTNIDLPDGWDDAEKINMYLSPYMESVDDAEKTAVVVAGVHNGEIYLLYANGLYEAGPGYQTFVRYQNGKYDILIQPANMNPSGIAQKYYMNTRMKVGSGEIGTEVNVFRREHRLNDPSAEIISEGTTIVGGPEGDQLEDSICSDTQACEEQFDFDEVQSFGCYEIDKWNSSACLWDKEACWLNCGYSQMLENKCEYSVNAPYNVDCANP